MSILSIQSSVAYGHVGNSAAVLPLQRLGFEVWPVDTATLSNHTYHERWPGGPAAPARRLESRASSPGPWGSEKRIGSGMYSCLTWWPG